MSVPVAVPRVLLVCTTMAATVGEVAFVGEDREEQSHLKGRSPKNLIARLPVQVRLTDGVPEACSPEIPVRAESSAPLLAGDHLCKSLAQVWEGWRGK